MYGATQSQSDMVGTAFIRDTSVMAPLLLIRPLTSNICLGNNALVEGIWSIHVTDMLAWGK